MDELFVMSAEARAVRAITARIEDAVERGNTGEVLSLIGELITIWCEMILPQEAAVLGPRDAASHGLPAREVAHATSIGRRLARVSACACRGSTGLEDVNASFHDVAAQVREHVRLLADEVLPHLYETCSDDDRWALARDLDRTVDAVGRDRWRSLVMDS